MAGELDEIDKRVVKALQSDFPITAEPYRELAEQAGITADEFIERTKKLKNMGAIRKMGAVLKHPKVGYTANVLCAFCVEEDRLDTVAKNISARKEVTHCYDRNTAKDWNYNLYAMIHGKSREECENAIEDIRRENGITEKPALLYSVKEWKKTSMKYYSE